jgi:soluble lytic murein transglycosylase-like protein
MAVRTSTSTSTQRMTRTRRLAATGLAAAALAGLGVVGLAGQAGAAPASAPASSDNKAIAKKVIDDKAQYACFAKIVERESGWDHTATNSASGAYGLMQALPAGKMSSAGSDWQNNPATQIKWGLAYMNERYGSPCDAWQFWQANHWY